MGHAPSRGGQASDQANASASQTGADSKRADISFAKSTPEALGQFIVSEVAKIGQIAKDVGARVD